ncbi:MAG: nuclear transport factor 2 family protein [Rubrivivax sp.]
MSVGPLLSHPDPRVARLIGYFSHLTPADLALIGNVYSDDASFKDPFNEVHGPPAIARIFEHMFESLHQPRFVIVEAMVDGDAVFLAWDFVFRMKRFGGAEQRIRGASHLKLATDGRIAMHRDYWDAAEELYEKLPVLGGLMRWLKRRVNA